MRIAPALVPLRLAVGVNVIASSAVLISARVPLKAINVSSAPSPVVKVRPVEPIVAVPPVMVKVTVWLSPSKSAIFTTSAMATSVSFSVTDGGLNANSTGISATEVSGRCKRHCIQRSIDVSQGATKNH